MIKSLLSIFLLSICSVYVYATDLVALEKTLTEGSYTHPDDLDVSINQKGWAFYNCKKDRFNGNKTCYLKNNDLTLVIINGNLEIFVGKDHFPDRKSAIKVDDNQTIYGYEGNFKQDSMILNQMLKGKIVYLRYVEWPYDSYIDSEVNLEDFTKQYEKLKEMYKSIK
ncbi:hypothetical protein MJ021_17930 [Acinetobacter baumannii]|uniref:hypothetical protein n=1 Tax=Acinetobacter baumannii TaxID=470 RepID=UPI0022EB6CFC|nr:hypothetical protein [Acinetobacter baumannii]MDA3487167.1 hypothetical protein [Acinetobacter baumannii]